MLSSFAYTLPLAALTLHPSFTSALPNAPFGPHSRADPSPADYYYEDRARIPAELMVGPVDKDGKRAPRDNCIFYVNQRPPMTSADPNYGKNRALNFAQLMRAAEPEGDYHTLYDVYDLDKAFNNKHEPMSGVDGDDTKRREWFTVTSEEYAKICKGTVYLVTADTEIWEKAIWWDELTALKGTGSLGSIWELRPEEIGDAYDWDPSSSKARVINQHPYDRKTPGTLQTRGGNVTQRADPSITIPEDIKVKPENDKTWNALKAIGDPDVNEDKDAPPAICPGYNYGIIDLGRDGGTGKEGYAVVETECKQVAGAITENPCTDPLFECSPPPIKIVTLHYAGSDYACRPDARAGRCPGVTVDVQYCCRNDGN